MAQILDLEARRLPPSSASLAAARERLEPLARQHEGSAFRLSRGRFATVPGDARLHVRGSAMPLPARVAVCEAIGAICAPDIDLAIGDLLRLATSEFSSMMARDPELGFVTFRVDALVRDADGFLPLDDEMDRRSDRAFVVFLLALEEQGASAVAARSSASEAEE